MACVPTSVSMPKGFCKGDPRAVLAGRKGGQTVRVHGWIRTVAYTRGYAAGWIACRRNDKKNLARRDNSGLQERQPAATSDRR